MYGPIPEGMQMHHLWYSEEYDPNSFVIITPEEHRKIHHRNTGFGSSGIDYAEAKLERHRRYNQEHREEINRKNREYRARRKELMNEQ